MTVLEFLFKYRDNKFIDIGRLILRVILGVTIMLHGTALFSPEKWAFIGKGAWAVFGVEWMPAFWGFGAKFIEFFGGICLILGLFFTPVAILLAHNMLWAAFYWLGTETAYPRILQPIENGTGFLAMIFLGPGRYSLDAVLFKRKSGQTLTL